MHTAIGSMAICLIVTTDGTVAVQANATTAQDQLRGFRWRFPRLRHTPSTQAQGKCSFQQNFPGGITPATGTFITAYRLLMILTPSFKMAVVSGTTVVTGVQYTAVGQNATIVQQHRHLQLTGNSQVALLGCNCYDRYVPNSYR
jgi:hypothetical protein